MQYVIDTCSFIEMKNNYRDSVFPDAWVNLPDRKPQMDKMVKIMRDHRLYKKEKKGKKK